MVAFWGRRAPQPLDSLIHIKLEALQVLVSWAVEMARLHSLEEIPVLAAAREGEFHPTPTVTLAVAHIKAALAAALEGE